MLVIISDLHLTDGTSGEIMDEKAFRIFRNRLSDMAYDASWRKSENPVEQKDEDYVPIENIDIILLGDIIDIIRSEKWNDMPESDMPWTTERNESFFQNISNIIDAVLINNKKSFAILKDLTSSGIKIPASMTVLSENEKLEQKRGYDANDKKVSPKVNIYYMVGNHDWFLYINDERLNAVRNNIINELGLSNELDKPFPYFPDENEALQKALDDHDVYALHGDIFDDSNSSSDGRDGSSVGDVVVLKIINEIPKSIEKYIHLAPHDKNGNLINVDSFVKELREIDNLRPYGLAPEWISQLIKKYNLDDKVLNDSIRHALKNIIDDFTNNVLIMEHKKKDLLSKLTGYLIQNKLTIEDLSGLVNFFHMAKDTFETYRDYAHSMTLKNSEKEKSYYVLGHTHYPEIVPMLSSNNNGKLYFNTGTWRTLHKQGVYDKSFISYKTMTIAALFKEDERNGHAFEYWTGCLDL